MEDSLVSEMAVSIDQTPMEAIATVKLAIILDFATIEDLLAVVDLIRSIGPL